MLLTKYYSGDQIRRMRWAGHVERKDDGRGTVFWCLNLREIDHLEGSGVDGRIILKWIFRSWMGTWNGFIWLILGAGGGLL